MFHFTRISEFIGKNNVFWLVNIYIVKIPAAGAAYWMVFHIRPNAIAYVTMVTSTCWICQYLFIPIVAPLVAMETTSHATDTFAVRDLRGSAFFSEGHKRYRGKNRGKIRYKRSPCLGNTAEFTPSYKNAKNFLHHCTKHARLKWAFLRF